MNETDKLIEEQIKRLPLNLQQAIDAVPWKTLVQEIGKTNALDTEKISSLEQETMFILYGFENPKDYVSNITKNIGISEDMASNIAETIADKIFDPILKKSNGNNIMATTPTNIPEIPPAILPVIKPEQPVKQDLVGSQPKVSLPDYRYEGGRDPYREPLA